MRNAPLPLVAAMVAAFLCPSPSVTAASDAAVNPLLAPWTGPHGGVPPFDKVRVEDIAPALEAGMTQELAEVEAIAKDPSPPTFENTIAALERAGRSLDRVDDHLRHHGAPR